MTKKHRSALISPGDPRDFKPSDQEAVVAWLDGLKVYNDNLKHLTTLNAGAIVVMAALFEKADPMTRRSWYLAGALACFVFSTLFCVMGMRWGTTTLMNQYYMIRYRESTDPQTRKLLTFHKMVRRKAWMMCVILGECLFVLAIFLLAAYAWKTVVPTLDGSTFSFW